MRIAHFLKYLFASCLFMSLVACSPTRESPGEVIDDTWITTKVKAGLAADPDVKATEVQVETYKGVVQLSGFVSTSEAAQKAVSVARGVKGVRDVKNAMVVRSAVAQ